MLKLGIAEALNSMKEEISCLAVIDSNSVKSLIKKLSEDHIVWSNVEGL